MRALCLCLKRESLLFQSSTLDNIAATVAKDNAVQAAAVSLVKAASAASGAYWTAAPKVCPGVPVRCATIRRSVDINLEIGCPRLSKCSERKILKQPVVRFFLLPSDLLLHPQMSILRRCTHADDELKQQLHIPQFMRLKNYAFVYM